MIPESYSSREYYDVYPATDSGVNRQMILTQSQPIFIRQTRFCRSLLERFPEVSSTWLILGKDSMFQETYVKTEIVSSSSPDLIEAKNSLIAAQGEIIRLKDEKIERLTEEMRGYKAAAELLGKEKKNDAVSSSNGK